MTFEEIIGIPPFSLDAEEKEKLLTERLSELTEHHRMHCPEYKRMLDAGGFDSSKVKSFRDLPFLPVRLFKELELKSMPQEDVVKTMTSSGTTGQAVSKIYLDRTTASNQQKTMVKIVSDFTGSSRMPMIIIDCPSVVKNRAMFSARGAGILGFSIFGSKKIYALNDDMQLDVEGLKGFLEQHKGERILLFGFTFMIWQHFYKELLRLKDEGVAFDLSNGILIHGGGWKKLVSEAVSPEEFKERLTDVCGLSDVHDYYGMVEQTGCIYMQCECGHLHASNFSDVIIRNPLDFSECNIGERGIIQVVSTIPESYPGHSLLTEDEGMILGEDDCPCGRKGKYFKIFGRMKNAEIRGCSDTYAADHQKKTESLIKDAATETIINRITFLSGDGDVLVSMRDIAPKKPFHKDIVEFLNDVSKELMKNPDAKAFADVVTLGFWLRKASIESLRRRFCTEDGPKHLGRGVVFHIAPSNVPVNFAYSLASGLLCGNANFVRVPSKDFPQVGIIAAVINKTLEDHPGMRPYICLAKYDRDKETNDFLSSFADVRVIWGGDATIWDLRKSPLPPRATEITFADRYSLAVIDSDCYMASEQKDRLSLDFYNDTYLSDQNACTSPRAVVWTGTQKEAAKKDFWERVYDRVKEKYEFQSIMGVDKLSQCMLVSANKEKFGDVRLCRHVDNTLYRVEVDRLKASLMDYRGNCGYFYEYDCDDVTELRDFCNDTRCQTVGYIGEKGMLDVLMESGIKGVDRVVSVGHTMDFDLNWDGYNLVERLTRIVTL